MVILEIKSLNNLRESDLEYIIYDKSKEIIFGNLTSHSPVISSGTVLANLSLTNVTAMSTDPSEAKLYHKNYLGLLLVLMVAFFILSYYLHYVSKYNIKKAKSTNTESNITYIKYSNLQNLSIANFSKKKNYD